MKKFSNVLIFVLCITLSFGLGSTRVLASSEEGLSTQEQTYLNELLEVDTNFEVEGEIVSVTKTTDALDIADTNYNVDDGMIRPFGAIGSANMSIYIVVSRVNDPGWDTFNISATATWKTVPFFRMQDGFAISWGGNFALETSYAQASYKSMGITSGKTQRITDAPNSGVGYSVEASHYYGQALDWVRINARISQTDRTGKANVSAAYCHRTASIGGIGISFSGESRTISFSVTGASDSMSNSTSFTY